MFHLHHSKRVRARSRPLFKWCKERGENLLFCEFNTRQYFFGMKTLRLQENESLVIITQNIHKAGVYICRRQHLSEFFKVIKHVLRLQLTISTLNRVYYSVLGSYFDNWWTCE